MHSIKPAVAALAASVLLATLTGCAIPPSTSQIQRMNCGELVNSYATWGQYYFHASPNETREALRRRFLMECSGWPTHIRDYVATNQVREGMSTEMVWWSWGPPLSIDHSSGPFGDSEIWEWSVGTSTKPTASFSNGALVWWQSP